MAFGGRDFELEWEIAARPRGWAAERLMRARQLMMRALRDKGILGGTDSGQLERPRASNLGLGAGMPAA
jgi:hypothetical protein